MSWLTCKQWKLRENVIHVDLPGSLNVNNLRDAKTHFWWHKTSVYHIYFHKAIWYTHHIVIKTALPHRLGTNYMQNIKLVTSATQICLTVCILPKNCCIDSELQLSGRSFCHPDCTWPVHPAQCIRSHHFPATHIGTLLTTDRGTAGEIRQITHDKKVLPTINRIWLLENSSFAGFKHTFIT